MPTAALIKMPHFLVTGLKMPAIGGGILLLATILCLSAPAFAQQDTSARIDRLENEIETLSRAVFRGEAPPEATGSPASASERAALQVRLSDLERDIRDLTGQIEEQQYELRRLRTDMEQKIQKLEVLVTQEGAGRPVRDLERREEFSPLPGETETAPIRAETPEDRLTARPLRPGEAATPPPPDEGAAETPEAAGTLGQLTQDESGALSAVENAPVTDYEAAFSLLKDGEYEKAEDSFKKFLETYPDHSLAANAQYWLGETHYVRGNYEQAARIFAAAYQAHPDGPKGADNLLKLALSLEGLNKREDACLTLKQLMKEYPSGAGPVLVRAEQEMKRLQCR